MIIAWPTHNQRATLKRSLESISADLRRAVRLVVSNSGDESIPDSELPKGPEILQGEKRRAWIEGLKLKAQKEGLDPQVVDFALSPRVPSGGQSVTTGANRNFLLLYLSGEKFLSVDDDVLLEPRIMPSDSISGMIPSTTRNPLGYKFLKGQKELEELIHLSSPMELSTFLKLHFDQLKTGRSAVTMSGNYGDSGFGSNRIVFGLEVESLQVLLQNSNDLHSALESRLLWRQSETLKELSLSPFMPMCAGFANDQELPPFFPLGRNQDGAFVYALLSCLGTKITQIPCSIFHRPLPGRSYSTQNSGTRVNDLVGLTWVELLRKKEGKGFKSAGEHFSHVGSLSDESFKEFLFTLGKKKDEDWVKGLEEKINRISTLELLAKEEWVKLAQKEVLKTRNSTSHFPQELISSSLSEEEMMREMKKWFLSYGQLLMAWPILRKLAMAK